METPRIAIEPLGPAVKVSIIDSTSRNSNGAVDFLMGPPVAGYEIKHGTPSYSFFVEHPSGRKVLFDLGVRKDFPVMDAPIARRIGKMGWKLTVERNVIEILNEHGVKGEDIEAIIWRYGYASRIIHDLGNEQSQEYPY
jgi:hypothetical protein